ncbi:MULTISPECIES: glycoside hydrolase domain-containing protein [unclassified Nocardioides]|uniref:glycoside hydrolase domain-containing protein n=1 Tax=unclassified Nocardioides TaxID=2615069 RepID=UPI00301581C1
MVTDVTLSSRRNLAPFSAATAALSGEDTMMVDEMVLAAQQWVNATYRSVSGFVPCREDGKTAWSVMYSLTRALQHELGITTLSDNFGPTTMSRITARGGIHSGETNTNIVKIIQCAYWCKGYNAGVINGVYNDTIAATGRMSLDAGVPQSYADPMSAKFVKALLTMDAFVIVAGGSTAVRSIQQWMNQRYIGRRDFYYTPCDGNFSRDVQKSFLRAVQFELGMTDDQATGTFGPGTQSGLRSHPVSTATSGVWASLFTAAMVFNGYGSFSSTFTSELAGQLRTFQRFSELDQSGTGDFATWAQLLVSTGDPNRAGRASDTATPLDGAKARAIHDAGYRVVGRYLDNAAVANPLNKKIQPGELATIFGAGLRVFPIQQYANNSVTAFTYARGRADALRAHDIARGHGFPRGTVIYFAVDYDATQPEIDAYVVPYFRGVATGLAEQGKHYLHGVYGSRNVCSEVTRTTSARWSFVLGMSTGYSGNLGFTLPANWSFNQIQTVTVGSGSGSVSIDKNVQKTGADPGVGSVGGSVGDVRSYVEHVEAVQALAQAWNPSVASRLTMEYLRHPNYTGYTWVSLFGHVDEEFIDHVESTGLQRVKSYTDPFYGIEIDTAHFAASCNALYLQGAPDRGAVNKGDIGGWGGDLCTFYGEWRRDSDSYASGYVYSTQRLAKLDVASTFKLNDLVEDADAFVVGRKLRAGSGSFASLVRQHLLNGGYQRRMSDFWSQRFGTRTGAYDTAMALLTTNDTPVAVPREALIQQTDPGAAPPVLLPDGVLEDFADGFASVLEDIVNLEARR